MSVATVLICTGDDAGRALTLALALAERGLDVSLVDAEQNAFADGDPLVERLRQRGVEVRGGVTLVGAVSVDRHVEAALSDGRVENYDAVVVADAGASPAPWRVVANGAGRDSAVVRAAVSAVSGTR